MGLAYRRRERAKRGWFMDDAAVRTYYAAVAPFYDAELASRDDLRCWHALTEYWRPQRTLEYGCGSGRVAIPLALQHAQRGGEVWGLDLAPAMLRLARNRWRRERGETPPGALQLRWGDMRRFTPESATDLVLFVDDPLTHIHRDADLVATFRRVREHLRPGGRLVVEASLLPPEARGQGKIVLLSDQYWFASSFGRVDVEQERRIDPILRTARVTYRYRLAGCAVPTVEATFRAHYLDLGLLEALFQLAGCRVEERWADFRCSRLTAQSGMAVLTGRRCAS
jgi:SAM-dependent methyltransferase